MAAHVHVIPKKRLRTRRHGSEAEPPLEAVNVEHDGRASGITKVLDAVTTREHPRDLRNWLRVVQALVSV